MVSGIRVSFLQALLRWQINTISVFYITTCRKKQRDEESGGPPDPSARLLKVTVAGDGDGSQSWLEKVAEHEMYLYIHHFGKRSKASDLNGHNFNSVVFI